MPVVELLQGEVPIISDLSKLVGEGPVTVLDVLEAISGNDLSLLRSILQFVRFVNTHPDRRQPADPARERRGRRRVHRRRHAGRDDQPLPEDAGEGITPAGGHARRTCSATSPRSPVRRTARPTTRRTSARRAAARRSASAA